MILEYALYTNGVLDFALCTYRVLDYALHTNMVLICALYTNMEQMCALYTNMVLDFALYTYRVLECASSKRMIWHMILIKFTIDKLNCNKLEVILRERNRTGFENALGQYMYSYPL